jgi:uncharacterized membrane protein
VSERTNERLLLFSDAVMAVAITLLVLDIRLPEDASGLTDARLWTALAATLPRIYAYILSFLVVAAFWMSHHQKFRVIPHADGPLMWLNTLFLLLIGLVPFVTSVIADSGNATATIVYAALMCAMACVLAAVWGYAWYAGLIDPGLGLARKRRSLVRTATLAIVFAASIPVAFVNADWAKYVWLLLIPASFIPIAGDAEG